MTIRVAIADDHPEMRVALRLLLRLSEDLELVCEAVNGREAVDCVKHHRPDVLVMDIRMPEMDGLAALQQIRDLEARTRVILISSFGGSVRARQAAEAGAQGFIPKEEVGSFLLRAIEVVRQGETFFVE